MDWIIMLIGGQLVLIVDGVPIAAFVGGVCYMLLTRTVNTILFADKPVTIWDQFESFIIWQRKEK
jgi:hypothetical protein